MDAEPMRSGVVVPHGTTRRLLVVDRTPIEATVAPEFGLVDLLISARTPVRYTMGRRNLARLAESINDALSALDAAKGGR